jgi:hypothetical protein
MAGLALAEYSGCRERKYSCAGRTSMSYPAGVIIQRSYAVNTLGLANKRASPVTSWMYRITTEGAKMPADRYSLQGYFELAAEGGTVVLRCSWPFDSDTDEWIYIENRYYAPDYLKAISDAATGDKGAGRARGINGGSLEITQINSGFLIEFSRAQSGWCANSLQLYVRRPVSELFPQALPFKVVHGRLFAQKGEAVL